MQNPQFIERSSDQTTCSWLSENRVSCGVEVMMNLSIGRLYALLTVVGQKGAKNVERKTICSS